MQSRLCRTLLVGLVACVALLATGARAQSCLSGSVTLNGTTTAISAPIQSDSQTAGDALGSYQLINWGDSARVSVAHGGSVILRPTATYVFIGPPEGTTVQQEITTFVTSTAFTSAADGACSSNLGEGAVLLGGTVLSSGAFAGFSVIGANGVPQECLLGAPPSRTLKSVFSRRVGENFTLTSSLRATSSAAGSVSVALGRRFTSITPGAALVRCDVLPAILGVGGQATNGLRIDSVWPNPSRGVFHANVFVPMGAPAFLRVFDVAGRVVQSRAVDPSAGARDIAFDTRMAPGTYFLHLQQGIQTAVRQVVIAE